MRAAPFLLGAALLFWGWQTGSLAAALAMAVALESARFVSWRLDLEERDFRRLWDLTCALFAGVGVYCYSVYEVSPAVLTFVRWTPAVFFPFTLAQAYSRHSRLPLDTFLWPLRRPGIQPRSSPGLSVAYPFLALCLLASSTAYVRDYSYYAGLCALAGWSLWAERPRRAPGLLTAGLFVLAVGLGHAGHQWMRDIQPLLERKSTEWFGLFRYREFDYFEGATAMGRIGAMKLSGRIALRLEPDEASSPPKLLRQVSYNQLRFVTWLSRGRSFRPVRSDRFADWPLLSSPPGPPGPRSAKVSFRLEGGRGLLVLPPGATRLQGLTVGELEKNPLGVVRVSQGPDAVSYRVGYGASATIDSPPDRFDLSIPPEEEGAVSQVITDLGLGSKQPQQLEAALSAFFHENFRYTNYWTVPGTGLRKLPVSSFLLQERAGHCEYFASATVLLLRRLGIPTRYATGYAVPPNARRGGTYLVRERHAHAWALAWIDGQWRDVDTTPPVWAWDDQPTSWLEPVRDWWSQVCFRWAAWRQGERGGGWTGYLVWLLAPLIAILGWRLVRRKATRQRARPAARRDPYLFWPGLDSEFYRIERSLRQRGLGPQDGETLARWLQRVQFDSASDGEAAGLQPLLTLHYRYRFDPRGLDACERARLAAETQAWLEQA